MSSINPNHPVLKATEDQWHKFVAVLLHKFNLGTVVITAEDIEDLSAAYEGQMPVVLCHGKGETIELSIVSGEEAKRLAKLAGGGAN